MDGRHLRGLRPRAEQRREQAARGARRHRREPSLHRDRPPSRLSLDWSGRTAGRHSGRVAPSRDRQSPNLLRRRFTPTGHRPALNRQQSPWLPRSRRRPRPRLRSRHRSVAGDGCSACRPLCSRASRSPPRCSSGRRERTEAGRPKRRGIARCSSSCRSRPSAAAPDQEFFGDGITEEMIAQIGALDPVHLGVIARTTSMQYKRSTRGVMEIGKELQRRLRARGQRPSRSAARPHFGASRRRHQPDAVVERDLRARSEGRADAAARRRDAHRAIAGGRRVVAVRRAERVRFQCALAALRRLRADVARAHAAPAGDRGGRVAMRRHARRGAAHRRSLRARARGARRLLSAARRARVGKPDRRRSC